VFRVQGTLPNMEICPNIARKSQRNYCLEISSFFFAFFSYFLLLLLYLNMDPEQSLANIMATANHFTQFPGFVLFLDMDPEP
jgi:hypothetical protein